MFAQFFKTTISNVFKSKRKRETENRQGMEVDSQPAPKRSSSIQTDEVKEQPAIASRAFITPGSKIPMGTPLTSSPGFQWGDFPSSSHGVRSASQGQRSIRSHTDAQVSFHKYMHKYPTISLVRLFINISVHLFGHFCVSFQAGRSLNGYSPLSIPMATTPTDNYKPISQPTIKTQKYDNELIKEYEISPIAADGPATATAAVAAFGAPPNEGPPMPFVAAAKERISTAQNTGSMKLWRDRAHDIISGATIEAKGTVFKPSPPVDPSVLQADLARQKYVERATASSEAQRRIKAMLEKGKRVEQLAREKDTEAEQVRRRENYRLIGFGGLHGFIKQLSWHSWLLNNVVTFLCCSVWVQVERSLAELRLGKVRQCLIKS